MRPPRSGPILEDVETIRFASTDRVSHGTARNRACSMASAVPDEPGRRGTPSRNARDVTMNIFKLPDPGMEL